MSAVASKVRSERRIALIEPPQGVGESVAHALQLFDSMLWVFRGTTRSNWNLCSAPEADVVVVHRAEAARVDEWRSKGKIIVVLSTDASATTLGDHMLVYPFPAPTVLELLDRLDRQLEGASAGAARSNSTVAAGGVDAARAACELVEIVRTVRAARNAQLWVAVLDGGAPMLWLRGDGAAYYAHPEVRSSIRCGALHIRNFAVQQVPSPPAGLQSAPGDELAWFTGYYCNSGLAPWLSETSRYRLQRWPDFGLLRAPDALTMACQLRVVAALDAQPATPAALVVRARVTRLQTARTLNALSVSGLIDVDAAVNESAKRAEFTPTQPAGGFRQLLRGLRKHLQLRSAT